jgi:hypothetical protein
LEALVSGGSCWIAHNALYILPAACIGVAGWCAGEKLITLLAILGSSETAAAKIYN